MTPDNDTSTAPFGALAPNAAQAAVIRLVQRSGLKRGVFRPWMSRLINLMRPGPVDARYQGASFRFYHLMSATERGALFNPDYNLDELSFLRAHTPDGGVFVDIGANVGTYALTLANKGWKKALAESPALLKGLNVADGKITYRGVAEAFGMEFHEPAGFLK